MFKGINYPELCNDMWLETLYFSVDLTRSLNHLNKKLRRKGIRYCKPFFFFFEQQLFAEDICSENLDNFESLKVYTESTGFIVNLEYFYYAV